LSSPSKKMHVYLWSQVRMQIFASTLVSYDANANTKNPIRIRIVSNQCKCEYSHSHLRNTTNCGATTSRSLQTIELWLTCIHAYAEGHELNAYWMAGNYLVIYI
jgi:hypothetical protein